MKPETWYELAWSTRWNPILIGLAVTISWFALGVLVGKLIWAG